MGRLVPRIGLIAVAKAAGVSTATVSNTLNRPEIVAEATRAKVLEAIERMDFVPNTAAASLRKGNYRLFGLVVPDILNPFYAEIARGVTSAADEERCGVILCNSQDDPLRELAQLEFLAEHRVAGALVAPITADKVRLHRLRTFGARLVLVDRQSDDGCSVSIDDVEGGRVAAEHLINSRGLAGGLVLVNGPLTIPQCADRRAGVIKAIVEAGGRPTDLIEIQADEMTVEAGARAARVLVSQSLGESVICTNDQLAIGLIRTLTDSGISVPSDIAVVGYGDLASAANAPIPLTTVSQPKEELGRAAFSMILDEIRQLDTEHAHATTVFTPTLVVRQSAP